MPKGFEASSRIAAVMAHVAVENAHDLDGVMATFGQHGFFHDAPWDEHHDGLKAVRAHYGSMFHAASDLHIEVDQAFDAGEAVVLEVVISGTHTGTWRGLPPTGRRFELPLCAVFTFDDGGRLAGERAYYDRATILRQLGVFTEPEAIVGRVLTPLLHPVTMLRVAQRGLAQALARRRGAAHA